MRRHRFFASAVISIAVAFGCASAQPTKSDKGRRSKTGSVESTGSDSPSPSAPGGDVIDGSKATSKSKGADEGTPEAGTEVGNGSPPENGGMAGDADDGEPLLTLVGSRVFTFENDTTIYARQIAGDDYVGRLSTTTGALRFNGPYQLAHFKLVGNAFVLQKAIPIEALSADGRTFVITSAYDPQVFEFGGQTFVVFECGIPAAALAGSAHTCSGRLIRESDGFVIRDAGPLIQGHDFAPNDGVEVSASVPKLLVHLQQAYVYWTAVTIDATIAQFRTLRTRGAKVSVVSGRWLAFPDIGGAFLISANDHRAVDVMNPLPGDPNSDLVADVFALRSFVSDNGENVVVATAAVGGKTYPHDTPAGTYRIVFATAKDPLAPGAFDRIRLENGLTTMAGEYAHIVGEGDGAALRVAFRSTPGLPRYDLDRHLDIDPNGALADYPISSLGRILRAKPRGANLLQVGIVALVPADDEFQAAVTSRSAELSGSVSQRDPAIAALLQRPELVRRIVSRMFEVALGRAPSVGEETQLAARLEADGYAAAFRSVMELPEFGARPADVRGTMTAPGWVAEDFMNLLATSVLGRAASAAEHFFLYRGGVAELSGPRWRDLVQRLLVYRLNAGNRLAAIDPDASLDHPSSIYREILRFYVDKMIPGADKGLYVPSWIERTLNEIEAMRLTFGHAVEQIGDSDPFLGVLVRHIYLSLLKREPESSQTTASMVAMIRANGYFATWDTVLGSAEAQAIPANAAAEFRDRDWLRRNIADAMFVLFSGSSPQNPDLVTHLASRLATLGDGSDALAKIAGEAATYRQSPIYR